MFHWKLKQLIAECKKKKIPVTYRIINEETKISVSTLTSIAKDKTQRVDRRIVAKLLNFFSKKLDRKVEFGELLEWRNR